MTLTQNRRSPAKLVLTIAGILAAGAADASIFKGEALDKVANGIAWVVLIVVPVIAIVVFWLVHILPEKIAEQRRHPQAQAIKTLCLLSLFFGGLLWPLAWLWAYSKPVLYKLAYGTDVAEDHHGTTAETPVAVAGTGQEATDATELAELRRRLASLESRLGTGERG